LRPYIDLLARHGFGVLALDLRGHGDSAGKTNRLGWQGTQDVGAAVAFLQGRKEVRKIGGMGLSMGGEVLLGAASQYPIIQAIVADGASRRSTEELLALESERPLVRNFTARVMYTAVRLLSGESPPKPLLDSMSEAKSTRFLLIAAGNNPLETAFNQLFAKTTGSRALLWNAPGADHTGAFSIAPQEYERRVIDFFED
jgi:pimeloyl-ACP methyl ester carboxylesterase